MILQCSPRGICSWDYTVSGAGLDGVVKFNWAGESGSILLNGRHYTVSKDGFVSPEWLLSEGRDVIATASKNSVFTRSFVLDVGGGRQELKALSSFGRSMVLSGNGYQGGINPKHAFTRRAEITGRWQEPEVMLFGFWLSVLIWRRSGSNNGGGA